MTTLTEALAKEVEARKKRNIRDRKAREYIKEHPEIKQSPDIPILKKEIPKGTTECIGIPKGIPEYIGIPIGNPNA